MIFTIEEATAIRTACVTAITQLSADVVKSVTINGKSYQKYEISDIIELISQCDKVINSGTPQGRAILLCRTSRART